MAPARGARKVGLKRIDAALDAIRPMGFPERLVRRTVYTLLKAYGGDEGWTFIEEGSYKLLIDTILEEVEKCESENEKPKLSMGTEAQLLIENGLPKDHASPLYSLPQVDSIPLRKRKPCYGWLDSDDEGEPDLVYLTPAT